MPIIIVKKNEKISKNYFKVILLLLLVIILLPFNFLNAQPLDNNNKKKSYSYIDKQLDQAYNLISSDKKQCIKFINEFLNQKAIYIDSLNLGFFYRILGTCHYFQSEYNIALDYYSKSIKIFYKFNKPEIIADLYYNIAIIYSELGNDREAIEYYTNSVEIFKKINSNNKLPDVLLNLSNCYIRIKDYYNSIKNLLEALKITNKSKDTVILAEVMHNISCVYIDMKNYEGAMVYLTKAMQINKKYNNRLKVSGNLNNFGNVYFNLENYEKALDFYKKAFIIKQELNDINSISISYLNIGKVYGKLGKYDLALNYYNEVVKLRNKIPNNPELINPYNSIGKIYLDKKDYKNSEIYFRKSLDLSELTKVPNQDAHYYLSDLYEKTNKPQLSLKHLQHYSTVHDSILGPNSVNKINVLLTDFMAENKDKQIITLQVSNKDKEQTIRERTFFIIALFMFMVAMAVILIQLFRNKKKVLKARKELEEKNGELTQSNNKLGSALDDLRHEVLERQRAEIELLNTQEKLAKALDQEREYTKLRNAFIAMVSHEYRIPLTAISNNLGLLEIQFIKQDEAKHKKVINDINNTINSMVRILNDLLILGKNEKNKGTVNMNKFKLSDLLKEIIENVQKEDNNNHTIIINDYDKDMEINIDSDYFTHIVQNLLSNACKYSPYRSLITINIEDLDENFDITVSDQGIGIPEEDKRRLFEPFHRAKNIGTISGSGLGLAIVKMYIDMLGGKIELDSSENLGTKVKLTFKK